MNHCFIWGWIVTPMNCRLFLGMKIHLLAISWCSHTSTRVLTHSHKTIQNGCSTIFWYTWNYLNIPDVSWYNHQKTYCTNNLDVQWCGWFLAPSWRTTVIKRERIQSGLDAVTNPDWRCSPEGNRPYSTMNLMHVLMGSNNMRIFPWHGLLKQETLKNMRSEFLKIIYCDFMNFMFGQIWSHKNCDQTLVLWAWFVHIWMGSAFRNQKLGDILVPSSDLWSTKIKINCVWVWEIPIYQYLPYWALQLYIHLW